MTGWTWNQVRDQLDLPRVALLRAAWKDNPPLVITMRTAAEALGVEFSGGNLTTIAGSSGSSGQVEADPHAILAEIGQGEMKTYVAPARGLPVGG